MSVPAVVLVVIVIVIVVVASSVFNLNEESFPHYYHQCHFAITPLLLSSGNKQMNKVSFDVTILYCIFDRIKQMNPMYESNM